MTSTSWPIAVVDGGLICVRGKRTRVCPGHFRTGPNGANDDGTNDPGVADLGIGLVAGALAAHDGV
jgi:hypothetical protein